MNLTRTQGWGLFLIVWGLVPLAGIFSASSIALAALLAVVGLSFVFYGASMIRSGSSAV